MPVPPHPVLDDQRILEVVDGDGQAAEPGELMPRALVVWLHDRAGRPVPDAAVQWSTSDGGTLLAASASTDSAGRTTAYWQVGAGEGTQSARATMARSGGVISARFSATVQGLLPEQLINDPTVMSLSTYDGLGQVVHPDVVRTPRGWSAERRHLAITPYPGGLATRENPSVYVGNDGEHWTTAPGVINPIAPPPTTGGYNSDPDQLFVPETRELWLYYRRVTSTNDVLLMRSADGVHWSEATVVASAENHTLVSPSVVHRGPHQWRMWSVNAGGAGCSAPRTTVEVRSSSDGIAWSAPQAVSLTQPGLFPWHIDVEWIRSRHEYWALFNAKEAGNCDTGTLWLATSPDGSQWTTYPHPVLTRGRIPALRDIVYRSSFEYDPAHDAVTLWYSGARLVDSTYEWSATVQRRTAADLLGEVQGTAGPTVPPPTSSRSRRAAAPLLTNATAP